MSNQEKVREVFRWCMAHDIRGLREIKVQIRTFIGNRLSDTELNVAISREVTPAGDDWDYFPCHTSPPRYLSVKRLLQLRQIVQERSVKTATVVSFHEQLADLENAWKMKQARADRAQRKADALGALYKQVNISEIELQQMRFDGRPLTLDDWLEREG